MRNFQKITIQKLRSTWPITIILPAYYQRITQQITSSMSISVIAFEKLRISQQLG